jgi:hypothetical protein
VYGSRKLVLKKLIEKKGYHLEQIINDNVTGLFWKIIPALISLMANGVIVPFHSHRQ